MPLPNKAARLGPFNMVLQNCIGAASNEPALEVQGNTWLSPLSGGRVRGGNTTSDRYELRWVAGAKGLPQLNAVTDLPAGDTFNTASFLANLNADREFEILGGNASSDDVTLHAEGGIKIETDGGGTDAVILLPHLNTGQSAWTGITWGTDRETVWECDITTGSSVGNAVVIHAGLKLTNTPVIATDDNQAFFRYTAAENSGQWQAISSATDVDTTTATGVAVAASTRYHLKVVITSDLVPSFFVNGVLRAVNPALTTAIDLIPYIGILEGSAAAKHMYIHSQAISRAIA